MTPSKIAKLRREWESLRGRPVKAAELESLARKLGRKRNTSRGKEPVWESTEFSDLFPLAIPSHGARDLPIGTRRSILDQLEDDLNKWEETLDE